MKKIGRKWFVYVLILSLVVPNFSIPAYASEITENAEMQVLEEGVEEENIEEILEEVGEENETTAPEIDVNESNDVVLSEDIFGDESAENEVKDLENDTETEETKESIIDSPEEDANLEANNNDSDEIVVEEEFQYVNSIAMDNFNEQTEVTLSGNDIVNDKLLEVDLIDEKDTTILLNGSNSGTFGYSDGFTWIYDESTYTLTVTGEDEGINALPDSLPTVVCNNVKIVEFIDCVVSSGTMKNMFKGCNKLTSIDFSGLDTSNVTGMEYMFFGCRSLTNLDLSSLDTSNVQNMSFMFADCSKLTNLDLSSFDISSVTDTCGMFARCSNLVSLNISSFDTSSITKMNSMFSGCSSLENLDLRNFDTSASIDMGGMFSDCSSLISLNLSNFDTSGVTNMANMFLGCSSLENIDLRSFDTSGVIYMGGMFEGCSSLTSLDVSSFNTSNAIRMESMFSGCSSLTSLDLSSFDTSSADSIEYMFYKCSKLENLDLRSFDTSNIIYLGYLFTGCSSLERISTPRVIKAGQSIALPHIFADSKDNIVSKLTSAYCDKILTKTEYKITYYLNGGKNNSVNPTSYIDTTPTITLKNPTRTGYTFGGWYSDSKYTKKVTTIPKGSSGNKNLYAKWTANKYHVAFKGNGSNSGSMSKLSNRTYGSSYVLTANAFKKTGYRFTGWNTKANGTGTTYKDKESVKNLTSTNGATVTLYAQWTPIKYTIKYNLNGGKNNAKNPANYTITTATIKLQNPTKTGYAFKGWYSDSKFTKKVTTIAKGGTSNACYRGRFR